MKAGASAAATVPLFGLPPASELKGILALGFGFLAFFYLCYGFASYVSGFYPFRLALYLPFEPQIPFIPSMAWFYLSVTPLLCLAPLILRSVRELRPFVLTLALETAIASCIFMLLPIRMGYPLHAAGSVPWIFKLADLVNLDWNDLPALHAALALTAGCAYAVRCRLAGRLFFGCWVALIALSMLLTHQHHIADIAAGALLGGLGVRYIYIPRSIAAQESTQESA